MVSLVYRILTGVVILVAVGCAKDNAAPADRADIQSARAAGNFLSYDVAKQRRRAVSEPAYTISIDLDRAPDTYGGTVTATFKYGGEGDALTVDFLNGESVPFDYNGYFITLPGSVLSGGEQTLVIDYEHPFSQDGAGLYRYEDPVDGRVYLYTDFEPYDANRLFPHFDQPDLKARYTLGVRAPASWQVISSTRETEVVVDGDHRNWRFPPTEPLSSYVFSLHAGEYAVFEDAAFRYPLRLFVRQSLAQYVDAEFWFGATRQGFDFFDEYFGLPYPFRKYDQVIVPDFISGAMENVAAVTFSEAFVHRGKVTRRQQLNLASVIMHEMAHMWFGDITTMAWWNGLWLNESFATYMASLALSRGTDFKEAWHEFFINDKQWAYREDQLVTTHAIELPVEDTAVATTNFDGITYGKGASVLKQLGFLLGDGAFRQGVRDYLAANAWANTELEDFTGALGAAADRDLRGWTRRWLYTAGLNTIEVDYVCQGDKLAVMSLVQTAPEQYPTLREQRTIVALYRLDGDRLQLDHEISLEFAEGRTPVPEAEGLACPDLVYPNYGDHAYIKVALDERSLATARAHITGLADPLQRNMIWYDLFSMVLDARLPLPDFLDILETHLTDETDLNAAADLMWNLRSSFGYLHQVPGGDDYLADYAERFESLLWGLVESSDGDARQLWLSAYIDTANNEVAWQRLENLLRGELAVPGLELDQDQRWRIVLKLNEHQRPGHRELAVLEADRDRSSIGQENAVRAEVLSARGEGKYGWMEKATRADDEYSLRRSRTIVGSLFPYSSQRKLAEPYAVEMLSRLPDINGKHDTTFHEYVTAFLMPRLCNADNVARLKAAAKRYGDLDPAIVRGIRVAAQMDERCVKIGALMAERAGQVE